jgi:hypothetical protein
VEAKEQQAVARARRKELLELLAGGPDGVKQWNRRRSEAQALAPFRRPKLSGLDLSGAKLVDMPEGLFAGSRLVGAEMSQLDLAGAVFAGAAMCEARLRYARLRRADLTGADLEGADLTGSHLQGAVLTDASVPGVRWTQAGFDETTVWPAAFKLPEELLWTGRGPSPAALAAITERKAREGPIDLKGFMERMQRAVEKPRLAKALSMLKSERFQLFVEVDEARLAGIVKSQSDPDLVYSCALGADGAFGCCTQNLNVCGGLRGALCKHLLVLAIGLAQAGRIDPDALDGWVQRSALHQPRLDRDAMSAVLLKYKGAEAGEIDWRPTETVPEDFYAY